jgi:uncharacterized protein YbjQ (UPF0145 family)
MTCPLCGYLQPDGVKECLQCHTPLAGKAPSWRSDRDQAGEETDTNIRIERRRRPRPRAGAQERSVARERPPQERPQERPPERPQEPPQKRPQDRSEEESQERFQEQPRKPSHKQSVAREERHAEPQTPPTPPPAGRDAAPRREFTPAPESPVTQIVERLKRVIVSTTPELRNRVVREYKGIVSAGAMVRIDGWADYVQGLRDVSALRSAPFFELLRTAREIAMTDLKIEAAKLGANGVIGVTFQFEESQKAGPAEQLIWIVATGTAVLIDE